MKQLLIDFCESQMYFCIDVGVKRLGKYGDNFILWKLTHIQTMFWHKLGYFIN